jgi:hypothetical protein
MTMPSRPSYSEALDWLERWAKRRGLEIRTANATQQEPDYAVAIYEAGSKGAPLLAKTSRDALVMAAFYVVNTLDRLGVDVEGVE